MSNSKEVIEISKNRIYIEPDQYSMPGITHIGRLDFSSASQPLESHTHDNAMEFCYIDKGYALFQSGKQKWQLKSGECFVSYPDEIHGTGSHPLERMKLYWIGYRPEKLAFWLTEGCTKNEHDAFCNAIGPGLPRTFTGNKQLGSSINIAIDAYIGNSSMRSIVIKSSLLNLFLHLGDKKRKPDIISSEIQKVIEFINSCLLESETQTPSLQDCADIAGISLSRFKARFRSETGIPPSEFITRKKLKKASSLLSAGMSVTNTSIECDFSSSQYFATVFRRYMNLPPSKWVK